jgi:hypothetical protein
METETVKLYKMIIKVTKKSSQHQNKYSITFIFKYVLQNIKYPK